MNIAVVDVAARNGGAISVLKYFYEQHRQDKNNHYVYLLSTYHLDETENITVVNVPWLKRGWGSRLYFDFFGVNRYLKQYKIDEVLSLQNTILPGFRGKQTVYEHNALPFAEYRFSLSEDRRMWIYQNVIGKFMLYAIRRADHYGYNLRTISHRYFIVEKFYPMDFRKSSKNPIQKSKFFNLADMFGYKTMPNTDEIANDLNGRTWEEF